MYHAYWLDVAPEWIDRDVYQGDCVVAKYATGRDMEVFPDYMEGKRPRERRT